MKKLSLELDVSKINKDKIIERTYKTKDGKEVVQKIYKMELIELKAPKFLAQGDTWTKTKTHFIVESKTKEEREAKVEDNFVGDGVVFSTKEDYSNIEVEPNTMTSKGYNGEQIDTKNIPF